MGISRGSRKGRRTRKPPSSSGRIATGNPSSRVAALHRRQPRLLHRAPSIRQSEVTDGGINKSGFLSFSRLTRTEDAIIEIAFMTTESFTALEQIEQLQARIAELKLGAITELRNK